MTKTEKVDAWAALTAARLVIEEFGWCRGRSEDDYGRVCAVGALRAATGIWTGTVSGIPGHRTLREVIGGSVIMYNDLVATSKEDVLAVFDKAIERVAQ